MMADKIVLSDVAPPGDVQERKDRKFNPEYHMIDALVAAAIYLITDSVTYAIYSAVITAVFVLAFDAGWLYPLLDNIAPSLLELIDLLRNRGGGNDDDAIVIDKYDVYLGVEEETGDPVLYNLKEMGSVGVYAQTGVGKTSLLHSYVHWLIKYHTPGELTLYISDLKEGLDFRIYRSIPHLGAPVAETPEESMQILLQVYEELVRRGRLFKAVPQTKLCNSLDAYHRINRELGLDLPILPMVVVIFDEFQFLTTRNEKAVQMLIDLAKAGRAFGISLVCSTQLPKVNSVPSDLKSQFTTKFCGYMADPSNYYKIAEIPQEWWKPFHEGGKQKGRFIADVGGDRFILRVYWTPESELEKLAEAYSNGREELKWPSQEEGEQPELPTAVMPWKGSDAQKRAMLFEWFVQFERRPSRDDFKRQFGASDRTYDNWVPKFWRKYRQGRR